MHSNVVVVDVGGNTLKYGHLASSTYTQTPNYVRMNAKQHSVQIRRPIERGIVVNWTLQGDIWQETLQLNQDTTMLMTSPMFTPEKLLNTQDEVVFEEFQMAAYASVVPQAMVPHACPDVAFPASCIIDVGFSATYIVPLIEGKIVTEAVRRLNVGGKLLTNYLKECVSFRQFNMMDSFELINDVKEAVCRCSLDFKQEMVGYANRTSPIVQYALPDFVHTHRGAVIEATDQVPADAQVLRLGVEAITIPEVLFHPSDIGLEQAGLAEGIVDAITACPPQFQGFLYQRLLVTGGTSKLPHFVERLHNDLRPIVPTGYPIEIHTTEDPVGAVWHGAKKFANSSDFASRLVTKAEYLEHGNRLCRERFQHA